MLTAKIYDLLHHILRWSLHEFFYAADSQLHYSYNLTSALLNIIKQATREDINGYAAHKFAKLRLSDFSDPLAILWKFLLTKYDPLNPTDLQDIISRFNTHLRDNRFPHEITFPADEGEFRLGFSTADGFPGMLFSSPVATVNF
jgi:hypothetical protein